jgi:hypothetical protein
MRRLHNGCATAAAIVLSVISLFALGQGGVAAASFRPVRAVELGLPLDAGRGTSIVFAMDCVATGSCTAGGAYTGKHKNSIPMVATEIGGQWRHAVEVRLPADAASSPFATVTSIDCIGAGSCLAVGFYTSTDSAQTFSFAATEYRGRWTGAHLIAPPPGGGDPAVFGISCYAARSCTAVGGYAGRGPLDSPFAVTEVNGRWGAARRLRLPPDGNVGTMFAVSCPRRGFCESVGNYIGATDENQAVAVTESDARWGRGVRIKLPRGAGVGDYLASVSCPKVRFCTAVGHYSTTSSSFRPMVVTLSGRAWARARAITAMPENADRSQDAWLTSISCLPSGACLGLGHYFDKAARIRVMIMTESAGKWRDAREVLPPLNGKADSSEGVIASLFVDGGADCARTGYCAIGTFYQDKSGALDAMTAVPHLR